MLSNSLLRLPLAFCGVIVAHLLLTYIRREKRELEHFPIGGNGVLGCSSSSSGTHEDEQLSENSVSQAQCREYSLGL